jgi:hypothetical protein
MRYRQSGHFPTPSHLRRRRSQRIFLSCPLANDAALWIPGEFELNIAHPAHIPAQKKPGHNGPA